MKLSNLTIDADRTDREASGESQVGGIIIDVAVSHFTLDRVEIRDTTIGALLRRTRDSEITNSRFDRNNGHAIATGHESYPAGEFRNVKLRITRLPTRVEAVGSICHAQRTRRSLEIKSLIKPINLTDMLAFASLTTVPTIP
ncbi:hypothetical protein [Paenibacillus sp. 23TSA30-6]|uniref:hypothetical protein n=1 Tax=Paenibacillus sp. 23TSA30-6 TaxID=2546104 RepID=UPI001EE2C4FF|nr:hypothetical protein [Paenibacillus sp. 23TSA30-6]